MLDPITKGRARQQVEFYFSDSNLPRDKFLSEKVGTDPEGFVDLALLCTFNRMQLLLKSNVSDASKVSDQTIAGVAEALEASEMLVLSDDGRRVRRRHALYKPLDEVSQEVDGRSLYAAPFPFDVMLDALMEFFSRHGGVNCVRMRRHQVSKDFKGSVFVEFTTREEADRIKGLALEFDGAKLAVQPKSEYIEERKEERLARIQPLLDVDEAAALELPRAQGKRPREEDAGTGTAPAEEQAPLPVYEPGCLVHFDFGSDVAFGDTVTFGLVKDSFGGKEAGLQYVDYSAGDTSGCARFDTPAAATAAMASAQGGKSMIAGYEASVRVLAGSEEEAYVMKVAAMRTRRDQADASGGRRGRGRGRGGRHSGRGKRQRS